MSGAHDHGAHAHGATPRSRLSLALAVIAAVFVIEVVGGIVTGSLALLADAAHMLTDLGALAIAYAASVLAERRPTRRHTYGFHRAEVLAAFVNAELILVVGVGILIEAGRRLLQPTEVEAAGVLAVGAIGLVANLVTLKLLGAHGPGELRIHVRAAALEVLMDLMASVAVVVGALAMWLTGAAWIDPLISIAIGLAILPRALHILAESSHILLEGAPSDIDVSRVRSDLLAVTGVEAIHDLHVWTLTSGVHSASVHIQAGGESSHDQVLREVQRVLREDAGVDHATVQIEWDSSPDCENREHL